MNAKSTLLQILVGQIQPDKGALVKTGSLNRADGAAPVGYLAQDPVLDSDRTVWQEVLSAATELNRIEDKLRHLEARMADPDVYGDKEELEQVLAAHARAQADFERLDGYRYESRAREILHALGFVESDFELPTTALSGGQTKLVGLAKLLINEPQLLLLDEPDNHLDLDGKEYLSSLIQAFPGTVGIQFFSFLPSGFSGPM